MPGIKGMLHRLEIDLGLAAAGHSEKEKGGKGCGIHCRQQGGQHLLLLNGELLGSRMEGRRLTERIPVHPFACDGENPQFKQPAQPGPNTGIALAQEGSWHRQAVALLKQVEEEGQRLAVRTSSTILHLHS